jgi:hypothetical protein
MGTWDWTKPDHDYVLVTEKGYWVGRDDKKGIHVFSRFLKDAHRWKGEHTKAWGPKLISDETAPHLVDAAMAPEEIPGSPLK